MMRDYNNWKRRRRNRQIAMTLLGWLVVAIGTTIFVWLLIVAALVWAP